MRGLGDGKGSVTCKGGGETSGLPPVPFLSMPTDCAAGPETATLRVDSWQEPGSVREGRYSDYAEKTATLPAVTGCDALSFAPEVEVLPDTLLADEPVGLGVSVKVPQSERPGTAATPHLRDAVVTLPEGMSISPGIVDGIQACDESGPDGINFEGPESEEVGLGGELQLAAGHCPDASIVERGSDHAAAGGTGEGPRVSGAPLCGGPGQAACTNQDALDGHLYQLYLELGGTGHWQMRESTSRRTVTEANPATGQLTTKFLENPQTPFSELKIDLDGGPRAPVDNPAACGRRDDSGPHAVERPGITPEGLSVPGPRTRRRRRSSRCERLGTRPRLTRVHAGTVSPQAGSFSAFTLNFSRQDREQTSRESRSRHRPAYSGCSPASHCVVNRRPAGHLPGSIGDRDDARGVRRGLAPV